MNDCEKNETDAKPSSRSVFDYLLYGLSIPERALRSSTALVSGVLRESTSVLVPKTFQDSRTYRTFVTQMLNFMAQDVGGVKAPADTQPIEGYVAKKAVSNFVELAGLATFHMSPLTILAIVSDLAYGSNQFLKELSIELKAQGLIAPDTTIDNTAQFLEAISHSTSQTASLVDLPPLSLEALKTSVADAQQSLKNIDPTALVPQKEIQRMWDEVKSLANQNDVNLFQMGSAVGMYTVNKLDQAYRGAKTTLTLSANLLDQHVLNHYRNALTDIREQGFYQVLSESSQPYLDAVWYNFGAERGTLTEDLLNGKLIHNTLATVAAWWKRPETKS